MGCRHPGPASNPKEVHPAPVPATTVTPGANPAQNDFPGLTPASTLLEDDYELGELLGKGSFGSVYSGRDKKTGAVVAVKVMDRLRIKSASIEREWTVLSALGVHPHVVQFHQAYVTTTQVAFVMELMRGGELFDRLIQRGAYSEAEARRPFHQVAMALSYLHKRGIIHRDLKPENLLLCDDSQESAVKIADFGLSQLIPPNNEKMTKICGTWAYAAPEMSDPQAGGYDCKYDTWGFGVILFVVLSGYHPFDPEGGLPVAEIKARARAAKFDFEQPEWDVVSDLAKDLLRKLIVKNPADRLDSDQLLHHPWFTGVVPTQLLPDMGSKISAYQKRRRKLKASFYSSFFVASLLISASAAAAKRRSLAEIGDVGTGGTVTSGSMAHDEDGAAVTSVDKSGLGTIGASSNMSATTSASDIVQMTTLSTISSKPVVSTAGAPPSYVIVSPAQRLAQENKASPGNRGSSPSRRMGTPTGRLATIPSATGAAAKLHDDDDDEQSHEANKQSALPVAHEDGTGSDGTPRSVGRPSSTKPHATGGSGSNNSNKVVPVTVEDVEE